MVVRRSDTRTPSKPPLKTSTYQQSHANRLHRIEQRCWWIWSKKESAKPSRNMHSGKPELRHHQQSFLPQTSLVLSATGSLELRLVSSAILEHTNNNTSCIWLGLVMVKSVINHAITNCVIDHVMNCIIKHAKMKFVILILINYAKMYCIINYAIMNCIINPAIMNCAINLAIINYTVTSL